MPQTKKPQTGRKAPAKTTKTQKNQKQTQKPQEKESLPVIKPTGPSRGTYAFVFLILGIFAFLSYFNNDGVFIKFLRGFVSGMLGGGLYLLAPALIAAAVLMGFSREKPPADRVAAILAIPVVTGSFCQLFSKAEYEVSFKAFAGLWKEGQSISGGGALSGFITVLFEFLFSTTGAAIVLVCITMFVALSAMGLTISTVIEMIKDHAAAAREEEPVPAPVKSEPVRQRRTAPKKRTAIDIPMDEDAPAPEDELDVIPVKEKKSLYNKNSKAVRPHELFDTPVEDKPDEPAEEIPVITQHEPEPVPEPAAPVPEPIPVEVITPEPVKEVPAPKEQKEQEDTTQSFAQLIEESAKKDLEEARLTYTFPPLSLLEAPKRGGKTDAQSEIMATKERLEMTLRSFNINATISNIINGPSVTRYEMELEIGVKLNKLTSLADDIALSLGVMGVRIAAIPNKISTVGIEVPNKSTSTVYLREIISSPEFQNAPSRLTFAIGKNIGGEVMTGNISKLPHLLVAGTTGSGKSVCLNSLILSLMYKSTPDEVKFIMIDPKMVEFKIYNGIPHLLVPVVTEAKKAAGALQWAVTEMMKRYRLFSDCGARDIAGYNEHLEENGEQKMPYIVVIIDELADLMLVAAKEVEESICRVAQMGRAAGVHLVIATQSPRADVITGLMKANIPSRIAFKVASSLESRIILDAGGAADKLVGNGDMLFAPIGTSKPTRIQGSWVSDDEREKIVEFVKSGSEANYSEDVMHQIEKAAEDKNASKQAPAPEEKNKDYDEMLPQAVEVIFDTNQASVSMLQRRLKLGYSRAARLVDQMEEMGILGPFEGAKPRQIIITRQQWQEMQFVNGTAPIEKPQQPEGDPNQTMFSADDLFEDKGE